MIRTEIFESSSQNYHTCFENALIDVNNLIEKEGLKKEDILEYRTKEWVSGSGFDCYYHVKIIISYWK